MPNKIHSQAQMRKMFALESKGELPKGKAEEMARAEGHKRLARLPEYVNEKFRGGPVERSQPHHAAMGEEHMAHGGLVCPHCGKNYADGGEVLPRWLTDGEESEEEMREPENTAPGETEEEEEELGHRRRLLHAFAGAIVKHHRR